MFLDRIQSSAYNRHDDDITNNKNRRGPKAMPCEAPLSTLTGFE